MNFKEYQEKAGTFAAYDTELYPFFGLTEEVGEFAGLMAKFLRGDDMSKRFGSEEALRMAFVKEAGDVLWQLQQCLTELGLDLQEVAEMNIQKLTDRQARGVIRGAGDDR